MSNKSRRRNNHKRKQRTKKPINGDRRGYNHQFTIGKFDATLILNVDKNDNIVEVFLEAGKDGSTLKGFLEAISICINIGLRYSIPIDDYLTKFSELNFPPNGKTNQEHEGLTEAKSFVDYLVRYIKTSRSNGGFGKLRKVNIPSKVKFQPPDSTAFESKMVSPSNEELAARQVKTLEGGAACQIKGGG